MVVRQPAAAVVTDETTTKKEKNGDRNFLGQRFLCPRDLGAPSTAQQRRTRAQSSHTINGASVYVQIGVVAGIHDQQNKLKERKAARQSKATATDRLKGGARRGRERKSYVRKDESKRRMRGSGSQR